ncbi:MAG: magnesium/cobalt transporter CorA [Candidatus Riflebacteria bacterium]|nr:magnesium/cobalt transporter CorA [Candidatus Riflebacteria bacterium]
MMHFVKKGIAARKLGKPPGTIANYSVEGGRKTVAQVFEYGADFCNESVCEQIDELKPFAKSSERQWITITGLNDENYLKQLSEIFEIDKLTMEDIMNPNHRPKFEAFDGYIFVVMKILTLNSSGRPEAEQVSLIFNETRVLLFKEKDEDVFEPVRDRLRKVSGKLRNYGPDYLALMLIDVIVDNYLYVLDSLSDTMDVYEEELIKHPDRFSGDLMHSFKRELSYIRKVSFPLREITSGLMRSDTRFIKQETELFFRDVHDHVVNVIETIEALREMAKEIYDLYISKISVRTNEIMQTLTIISTVFIPLTFIVGVYGMNFENMPELKWGWGYFAVWVIMIVCAFIMVLFFKRKKWL